VSFPLPLTNPLIPFPRGRLGEPSSQSFLFFSFVSRVDPVFQDQPLRLFSLPHLLAPLLLAEITLLAVVFLFQSPSLFPQFFSYKLCRFSADLLTRGEWRSAFRPIFPIFCAGSSLTFFCENFSQPRKAFFASGLSAGQTFPCRFPPSSHLLLSWRRFGLPKVSSDCLLSL